MFARPDQPLEVDVGCMHGTFLLEQARRTPQHNFVGLEIRAPLVREVEGRIEAQALDNVFALLCNANTSFRELFPPSSLRRVYVHFPDPWFKTRHHKRRVMTPDFVDALAERLAPGGELVFMTDYEEYATKVVELLEAHPAYRNAHGAGQPAPPDPERAQTNREAWHASQGDPIHRYRWVRREDA